MMEGPVCMVIFKNWDGSIIQRSKCMVGGTVNLPVPPVRAEDEYNTYTFIGWDADLSSVTEDMEVNAIFQETHIIRLILMLEGEAYVSVKLADAQRWEELPLPTAQGKTFDKWYAYDDYNQVLTMELVREYESDEDVVCYGRWAASEE